MRLKITDIFYGQHNNLCNRFYFKDLNKENLLISKGGTGGPLPPSGDTHPVDFRGIGSRPDFHLQ